MEESACGIAFYEAGDGCEFAAVAGIGVVDVAVFVGDEGVVAAAGGDIEENCVWGGGDEGAVGCAGCGG